MGHIQKMRSWSSRVGGWVVAERNLELMTQNEVPKSQVASGSEQRDEAAEEQF
jgi:hypothetical protein